MKLKFKTMLLGGMAAMGATGAMAQTASNTLLGVNCDAPYVSYPCNLGNGEQCLSVLSSFVTQPGDTVEQKTRRTYFLDCPKGYKKGDKVNVVLSLHGGGSYANWQRWYFPVVDVKDKYKLVIITPGSPTRTWSEADDQYLQNVVDSVVGAVGKENVQRFILSGHSQGGITSNRIICTPYFRDKVDVRISLSGGRIGPATSAGRGFGGGRGPAPAAGAAPGRAGAAAPAAPAPARAGIPAATGPAGGDCDYSFIFSNGEYESIPGNTSPLADKFGCAARVKLPDVVDTRKGYVWDSTRQTDETGSDGWGRYPKPGKAEVYQFPNCKDGRVVADVIKLHKGHTEGYEPNITDKIMELATSAKGGKIATGSWSPPAAPAAGARGGLPGAAPAAPAAGGRRGG